MTGSPILSLVFLALVIVGAGIVGTQSTWRETIAGLCIQYVGVSALIGLTSGPATAIVGVIASAGVTLLLASDGYFSNSSGLTPDSQAGTIRARAGRVPRARPHRTNPWISSAQQTESGLRTRPFDVSVFGLVVAGALALALTRPLFGSMGVDGAVNVLLIGGVLGCLLGGEARVAGALLLILSAGSIALHAADPTPPAEESILLASAQIALALALVYLRSLGEGTANRGDQVVDSATEGEKTAPGELSDLPTSEPAAGR